MVTFIKIIPGGVANLLIEALTGLDPVEDRQLPDDEDNAGQVEQDEEEHHSQESDQLLMLILLRWEALVDRVLVDETEESDVGEAHHRYRQYRPEIISEAKHNLIISLIVQTEKKAR